LVQTLPDPQRLGLASTLDSVLLISVVDTEKTA
jgi:hypothetical protein